MVPQLIHWLCQPSPYYWKCYDPNKTDPDVNDKNYCPVDKHILDISVFAVILWISTFELPPKTT